MLWRLIVLPAHQTFRCAVFSEDDDEKVPAVAARLDVLVAFACVSLWPSAGSLLYLFSRFAAGLLLPAAASTLASFTPWMIPLDSRRFRPPHRH
jgi:hypothetical protein